MSFSKLLLSFFLPEIQCSERKLKKMRHQNKVLKQLLRGKKREEIVSFYLKQAEVTRLIDKYHYGCNLHSFFGEN
jgi:hypothetical protein